MGMQIDPVRKIYSFWDVNSGKYSYDSVDVLQVEFNEYIKEFYSGIFNNIVGTVYAPLDQPTLLTQQELDPKV